MTDPPARTRAYFTDWRLDNHPDSDTNGMYIPAAVYVMREAGVPIIYEARELPDMSCLLIVFQCTDVHDDALFGIRGVKRTALPDDLNAQ